MWETGSLDVRRALASDIYFLESLTDTQAKDIIDEDDIFLSRNVAEHMNWMNFDTLFVRLKKNAAKDEYDEYADDDEEDEEFMRLSEEQYTTLLNYIQEHPSPIVRNGLFINYDYDPDLIPPLNECLELGIEEFNMQILKESDLPYIKKLPWHILAYIGSNLERVRNIKLRNAIFKILLDHPDPEVRLSLAENRLLPTGMLKCLCSDPVQDIAKIAQSTVDIRSGLNDEFNNDCDDERGLFKTFLKKLGIRK